MLRTQYDYIIAGMGAAGLTLAMQLKNSKVPFENILLVDQDLKNLNDRTWCYWTEDTNTWLEPIVHKRWSQFEFKSNKLVRKYKLAPYHYQMIKGIDFYTYCLEALRNDPRFHILTTPIYNIFSDEEVAVITVPKKQYYAKHLFNSAFRHPKVVDGEVNFVQHFKGWVIETPQDAFDDNCPTFMDFRTDQYQDCRFFYVIPHSKRKALIEYTGFSPKPVADELYEQKLANYIEKELKIKSYTIVEKEYGEIPMTESTFQNPYGEFITNIGTAGGYSKPSTGYTFYFIQKNIAQLVKQMEENLPITQLSRDPKYRYYDQVLLDVMSSNKIPADRLFTKLFKNNKISRLLTFLNEESSFLQDLSVMLSVPTSVFLPVALKKWKSRKVQTPVISEEE